MHKNLFRSVNIAGFEVANNLWLAPLAGFSHKAMRMLCRKYGAGLAVTEMVSVEGLVRGDRKTLEYIDLSGETGTVVQLFAASEPEKIAKAAKLVMERTGTRLIDFNFGCPVRKVIRNGAGSCLLKTPSALTDIVQAVKSSGAIASAKIRSGFAAVNMEETIAALNAAGADIICLHPRLATQMYTGHADWGLIKRARELTNAILVASGDVKSPEDAEKVLIETGADAVMIGRAAIGKPFLFAQTAEYLNTGSYREVSVAEIKEAMLELAATFLAVEDTTHIRALRMALGHFVRGIPHSAPLRAQISGVNTYDDLKAALLGLS